MIPPGSSVPACYAGKRQVGEPMLECWRLNVLPRTPSRTLLKIRRECPVSQEAQSKGATRKVVARLVIPPARLLARHRGTYDRYSAHPYHIRKFLLAAVPFWVWSHARSALRSQWNWAVRGGVVILRLEGLSCPDWFVEMLQCMSHTLG